MTYRLPMRLCSIAFVLFTLSSCTPRATAPPSNQVSVVVALTPPAQLTRAGWGGFEPIGFGALVFGGDVLSPSASLVLLCSDLQTVKPLAGRAANPCPLPLNNAGLTYTAPKLSSSKRGVLGPEVPYLLYPRNTLISETLPLLRWHATGTATATNSYTLTLKNNATQIWQQTAIPCTATAECAFAYPATAPALQSGTDYLLVISDSAGHSSNEDPSKGLGFQVADPAQQTQYAQQAQAIQRLTALDPAAQQYVLALYYSQVYSGPRGLWAEATQLLLAVAQTYPQAPAVQLRLGETYARQSLWAEAAAAYDAALTQAQTLGDRESQAVAHAALWRITGDTQHYNDALNLYQQLGAQAEAEALQKEKNP